MLAVIGLLVLNLGSPDAPTPRAVRRYLRQFLSDPRVIDIHPVGRALLLNLVILPFRPRRSAAAYQKVWMPEGSPLLVHSRAFAAKLGERLGAAWRVELGMRYGSPSIASALGRLVEAQVDRIVVFPLYPQYASSSTGSSLEETFRLAGRLEVVPPLQVVGDFYDEPGIIEAHAAIAAPILAAGYDHVLFSFHGLPERQVKKTSPRCFTSPQCCDAVTAENRHCYRAQCYATARALAARLGLREGTFGVSFQSRLGRTPWIQPHTDVELPKLAAAGKKRLAVFCPAFVADCLETLEEIGIRGREQFVRAGGEVCTLVPSLNATPRWVAAAARLAQSVGNGPPGE
jgi:protoporphyrin/coproporphyrin ferrochelatase